MAAGAVSPPPVPPEAWEETAGPLVLLLPAEPACESPVPEAAPLVTESSTPFTDPRESVFEAAPEPTPAPPEAWEERTGPLVIPPPDPETAGPAPDPEVLESQSRPPEAKLPELELETGREESVVEPGKGLEQVRIAPAETRAPVERGAVVGPAALHDSGPRPASMARDSRRSTDVRRSDDVLSVRAACCVLRAASIHRTSPWKTYLKSASPLTLVPP